MQHEDDLNLNEGVAALLIHNELLRGRDRPLNTSFAALQWMKLGLIWEVSHGYYLHFIHSYTNSVWDKIILMYRVFRQILTNGKCFLKMNLRLKYAIMSQTTEVFGSNGSVGRDHLSVIPINPFLWTFWKRNFNLVIAKLSVISWSGISENLCT